MLRHVWGTRRLFGAALAATILLAAQDDAAIQERLREFSDIFKLNQITLRAKRTGEQPTADEKAWMDALLARRRERNEEYRKTHQAKESWGIAALPDLETNSYKGQQGGLYPGGNTPPAAHLAAGLRIAKTIAPLDSAGKRDENGKIVLISFGFSNWTQEFNVFVSQAMADPERNPKVLVIDCAVNSQSAEVHSERDAEYFKIVDQRLRDAGVTAQQVQVVMLKAATQLPKLAFPGEPKLLQSLLKKTVRILEGRFPNLKLLYSTSRTYGGYADIPLNPEPHAFETGFAVKWLIASQIEGDPELAFTAKTGTPPAPWLAWGPYLWADGTAGRKDGMKWMSDDFRPNDHTHPSESGCKKVSGMISQFLKNDPTTKTWYLKP